MPEPTGELDRILVRRLRAGDEAAFMRIVDAWGSTMLGLAREFTPSRAVAEEVVQETWLAVLNGLDRFEGRSSLKTWVFRILVNRAKTRGIGERRTVPFAVLRQGGFRGVQHGRRGPLLTRTRAIPATGARRRRGGRRNPRPQPSRRRRSS